MPAEIPTNEPSRLVAGDRWQWRREDLVDDYPASAWSLTYYLRSHHGAHDISASADGDEFAVDVSSATTAAIAPGIYKYQAIVDDGGSNREVIEEGRIEVVRDFSATGRDDFRSHARRVLEAIEATIERKATHDQTSMTVSTGAGGSTTISRLSWEELLRARAVYRGIVRREEDDERVADGKKRRNKFLPRFSA